MLKPLVISITLLFPAVIYLFLRFFGTNQFEVPVYYLNGVNPDTVNCTFENVPHRVLLPTSYEPEEQSTHFRYLTLVDLNLSSDAAASKRHLLQRIANQEKLIDKIKIIQFIADEQYNNLEVINKDWPWTVVSLNHQELVDFAVCQLILLEYTSNTKNNDNRWVLIDTNSMIRGYYDSKNFEDINRLIVEMEIISE